MLVIKKKYTNKILTIVISWTKLLKKINIKANKKIILPLKQKKTLYKIYKVNEMSHKKVTLNFMVFWQ